MRAILVPASNIKPLSEIQWETLRDLQKAVGGWVERVEIIRADKPYYYRDMVMVVDEEFLIKGEFVRGYNARAGLLYGETMHGQPILGNALIVGEGMTDEGIDFCDLDPEYTIEYVTKLLAKIQAHHDTLDGE